MPVCVKCNYMDATVNMRRRRPPHTGEWACKDTDKCKARVRRAKEEKRGQRHEA